jgi:hypothetical protein
MEPRKCIHDRTESQACSLCKLRSACCGAPVYLDNKKYTCENCGEVCSVKKKGK